MRRAAVVFVALTACGDNITGLALDDYGDARRTAECERLTRCGLFSAEDACERSLLPALRRDMHAAIDAGKIAYDGVAAKSCLEAIAVQSCDATSADARITPPACARVFSGRVADGDTCAFDTECASGSCDAPDCRLEECCTGTCRPTIALAPLGAPCNRDADCVDGFCGADQRCHARVAARETCSRDEECEFDLACIGATDLDLGRCRDMPLVGEACPYMRCAEIGVACMEGNCAPVGLIGTSCTTAADCSPYGECAPSGQCSELPRLGAECTTSCSRDAWCDAGTCAALLPNTEPCTAGNQCESLYCQEGTVFDACTDRITCI